MPLKVIPQQNGCANVIIHAQRNARHRVIDNAEVVNNNTRRSPFLSFPESFNTTGTFLSVARVEDRAVSISLIAGDKLRNEGDPGTVDVFNNKVRIHSRTCV